jgi:hypothetical protein
MDIGAFITRYLNRPFRMFFTEPILVFITLYMTFISGFIYLLFEVWPISFIEQRGYNHGVGALPFISIGIGVALGLGYVAYVTYTRIMSNFKTNGFVTYVSPFQIETYIPTEIQTFITLITCFRLEDRLYPMIFGAVIFPIAVFWFAWTSFPSITPWPQILAGIPIGAGIQIVYLQGLAYMVDVYTVNANSAISANAIVRYVFPNHARSNRL